MKTFLKIFVICLSLSACRTAPKAPLVERCLLFLPEDKEVCFQYRIDAVGGETIPETEVIRNISDRSVCFSLDEWEKIAVWRDKFILWTEDYRRQCGK